MMYKDTISDGSMPTIIYILSTGHSGSTLLDMILNASPLITALGEVETLRRYIPYGENDLPPAKKDNWPVVRYNVLKTDYWKKVKKCFEDQYNEEFTSLIEVGSHPNFRTIAYKRWKKESLYVKRWTSLFKCASTISGTPYVTDSSKSPHRLLLLARAQVPLNVIHLIRDGRGVFFSYIRKYKKFSQGIGRWMLPTLESLWVKKNLSDIPWLTVRYEEMVKNTKNFLMQITNFLEIPLDDKMYNFWKVPYLGVGGNRLREHPPKKLILDEKWRRDLPIKYRIAFALVGGWLNKIQGYEFL